MDAKMLCFQCQETAGNEGCTVQSVCGKKFDVAGTQDLLIYVIKGLSTVTTALRAEDKPVAAEVNHLVLVNLFITITNTSFDRKAIKKRITETLARRNALRKDLSDASKLPEAATEEIPESAYPERVAEVGVLITKNESMRSLRELITYGLKGLSTYTKHMNVLLRENEEVDRFLQKALVKTLDNSLTIDDLVVLTLETGKYGVEGTALLDGANAGAYGNSEITGVNIGVYKDPGILISGHDLEDLEMLLDQAQGTGVDVCAHSEMLPAHYCPFFKKYSNFAGNYDNTWWKQKEEFGSFNGPILMTMNHLVPLKDSYKGKVWTTGCVGSPDPKHIDMPHDEVRDFGPIIEQAGQCPPPTEIETGKIAGGFTHAQVFVLADKVVDAVKSGAITKFVVMAGYNGRAKNRSYCTEPAEKLPEGAVTLTAGYAKYKYNKLDPGDIGGIPRMLDAGQCNDPYSLAVIALKLEEIFGFDDVNQFPPAYNIAWYEQKAVIVLPALLYLGVKNIHLGPTLPAFLSPDVADVLIKNFGIAGIDSVEDNTRLFFGKETWNKLQKSKKSLFG